MLSGKGYVLNVFTEYEGSVLASAVSIGADTVYMEDIDNFDEDGGQAQIRDHAHQRDLITYTGLDYSALTLTGVTGLTHDYTVGGTTIRVYPRVIQRYAEVQDVLEDDTTTCLVPHHFYAWLPVGARNIGSGQTEMVLYVYKPSHSRWQIADILGKRPRISKDNAPPERVLRYECSDITEGLTSIPFDDNGKDWQFTIQAVRVVLDDGGEPNNDATFTFALNGTTFQAVTVYADELDSGIVACTSPTGTGSNDDVVDVDDLTIECTALHGASGKMVAYVYVTLQSDKPR